jgi:hypothetical protein
MCSGKFSAVWKSQRPLAQVLYHSEDAEGDQRKCQ